MLTHNQQYRRSLEQQNNTKTTTANAAASSSIIDSDAVSEKVNEWIGSFSAWTSSVQKSVENTLTSFKESATTTTESTLPTTTTTSKKKTNKAVTTANNADFIDIDLSNSSSSSKNNNNTLKKSQPTITTSSTTASTSTTNNNNKMMEKRSLMRNQDFSSGEEDEESIIGSLKKKGSSLFKPSSNNTNSPSSWLDSIKTQLFSENKTSTAGGAGAEEDDSPLAKSLSTKSPSPTVNNNNLLDSLSSTFSSLKTQTNDKWSSLTSQFFETQPPIDENDNSFIGRLSKEFDGMATLTAKQRMYGFFMALGFGVLCILIALGFLPSILFATGAFAFFYTFGNLLCLTSTLFLVGPAAQLKNMTKPERAIPSILFVGSMFLTLLCVFFMPLAIFIIILVVVQTVSLAWYVVSYIPFAQSILGMVFSSFMKLFN